MSSAATVNPALGYITREDTAVKAALESAVVVGDRTGSRPVRTFFRLPEDEAVARVFPYIVIDFLNARRDPTREHRGLVRFRGGEEYNPFGVVDGDSGRTDYPIPMSLEYQITAFSRMYLHDRQITNQLMMSPLLRPRFGALEMVGAFDDNSIRRVDLLSGPTFAPTRDEDRKRVFRTTWEIAVSSEYFQEDLERLVAVGRVGIDVLQMQPTNG